MKIDYLVVGSGLTGAVIARKLIDAGREVLVVDRRSELGGNVHDHSHPSGIRIHTYGPHYFRTNSDRIWKFVTTYGEFFCFEAVVKTRVDAVDEDWPVSALHIQRISGETWHPPFQGQPTNFEEASLTMMPRVVYERFVKSYTEKQWGVVATSLSVNLAGRFEVNPPGESRLKHHTYQGLPLNGYTAWMTQLLRGIPLLLNLDYLQHRETFTVRRKLIFTGPIDEYYNFDLGKLAYRSQRRTDRYIPDVDYALSACQVNNPSAAHGPHIRTLEWKRMMPQEFAGRIRGTVLTEETPESPQDPDRYEYPFPDATNANLYERYRDRAHRDADLLICGRLGEYRYYDMDQAIARAVVLADRLLCEC